MTDNDLRVAVQGWEQALGIVRKLHEGLRFTVNELNWSPRDIRYDPEKAEAFERARQALRTADAYLAAMDQAKTAVQS